MSLVLRWSTGGQRWLKYFGQSGESRRIDSKFGKVNHLAWSHLLKGTHPTTLLCMCECGVFFLFVAQTETLVLRAERRALCDCMPSSLRWNLSTRTTLPKYSCTAIFDSQHGGHFSLCSSHVRRPVCLEMFLFIYFCWKHQTRNWMTCLFVCF